MAKSINKAIKQAAIGVRMGRIFKYIGSINPIPPKIFEEQIKFLIPSEYASTHDNLGVNFSFGINIMINPDAIKAVATMPCKIQSVVFIIVIRFKVKKYIQDV